MTPSQIDTAVNTLQGGSRSAIADRGRIRVCHLSMTLLTGGLERLLVEYGRLSDPRQFEVSYIALEDLGPPAEELRELGFAVEALSMSRNGKCKALKSLISILRERKIDLLHAHNTYPQFYGALAGRWAGVPVILGTQHGRGCGPNVKSRIQFSLANCLTTKVFGVSEDSARMCRLQDRWHAGKIDCIRNGIDTERFAFHGPASVPTAISVARLSPEKDFATLLRAVPQVAAGCPEFRLLLVGDGRERGSLERLAQELGIQDRVEFLGERRDIPQLLTKAGFFVSSSKTEGISLTLLEAMAVGLPIVATAVGGNPEVVEQGVTGLLVPSEQPEQLAQAILEMLSRTSEWGGIAEAARRRVEQQFDIRIATEAYQRLYMELLRGKRRLC